MRTVRTLADACVTIVGKVAIDDVIAPLLAAHIEQCIRILLHPALRGTCPGAPPVFLDETIEVVVSNPRTLEVLPLLRGGSHRCRSRPTKRA